jgi:hypothetical protein
MYRLSFSCNNRLGSISLVIVNYFNKFPLKTTKQKSFETWTFILNILLARDKGPLSEVDLIKIRKARHNMNYFTIQNNPTGNANKS